MTRTAVRRALGAAGLALLLAVALPRPATPTADAVAGLEPALARIAAPPLGLPPVPLPADNPPTAAKIALGRKLFFDRRLSQNGTMSCAMCHLPEQGFTNRELARPIGVEGRSLRRNAPTLLNVAYVRDLFHDGREISLETQALAPLLDPREMANPSPGAVLARLAALPDYRGLFERAFGAGPSLDRLGQALATYQRTLLAARSPFDRWYFGGDADALAPRARDGFRLFTGKAGCVACHAIQDGFGLFTDGAFHDTGVARARAARRADTVPVELAPGVVVPVARAIVDSVADPEPPDLGRHEVTLHPADRWRFRTPSLRNVALTGPYMHDGSLRTLRDVLAFYDRGGTPGAGQDPRIRPLGLDPEEMDALVAFLESLTGDDVATLVVEARGRTP
jgi:cytochrome c peroxidase